MLNIIAYDAIGKSIMEERQVRQPTLYIFDMDGTLIQPIPKPKGGTRPANKISEQVLFDDVLPKCAEIISRGDKIAIASNQGGVAFGIIHAEDAERLVKNIADLIGASAWDVCCYHPRGRVAPWNQDHSSRKPNPGMLFDIMETLDFRAEDTIMVGDSPDDEGAAKAAGVLYLPARVYFGRG